MKDTLVGRWCRHSAGVLIFKLLVMVVMLGPGCISFHRGYKDISSKSETQGVEIINGVSDISLTARAEQGKIVALCSAVVSSSSVERETTTTTRRERKLAIGLVPGMRREMDTGSEVAWYPFEAVFMNVIFLGIPTVSSLFITPFAGQNDSKAILMADMGLLGSYRYTIQASPQVIVKDRPVNTNPPRRTPLKGVRITCSIPDLSFSGVGVTNAKGECKFAVGAAPGRRTGITLTVADAPGSAVGHLGALNGFTSHTSVDFLP